MNTYKLGFFLSLRTLAYGFGFLITVLIFLLFGSDDPLIKASPWWPVYGMFANFLCFLFVRKQVKLEKITFRSMINFQSDLIKKDLLKGLVFIFISVIIAISSSIGFGYLLYGRFPNELMLSFDGIPIQVIFLFIFVSPIINSTLEEVTYNGFIFPKLEKKLNSVALSVIVLLFFFTIQHIFITFKPDIQYMIWRLLSFVPLLLFWILIYIRMRRLTTLILVHWFMDTFAIISIILGTK